MVAFAMIVSHEFTDTFSQRASTKQDHPTQTIFLNVSDKSFRVGIQGDRGGSLTRAIPAASNVVMNSVVNSGSRS